MLRNTNGEKNKFKIGQFVMIRRINDITKKGKELAKRIIGPYLIIKMEGAVVTLIDSKSH